MGKLLDHAKSVKLRSIKTEKYTDDDFELVEAWLKNEITIKQMQEAKKFTAYGQCYVYIAMVSRAMMLENGIRTKKGK